MDKKNPCKTAVFDSDPGCFGMFNQNAKDTGPAQQTTYPSFLSRFLNWVSMLL
jgi:hypothetical protein